MLKDFTIRLDGFTVREEAKIKRACKAIAAEYKGEFLTTVVDKNYRPGLLKLMNTNRDKEPFWEER